MDSKKYEDLFLSLPAEVQNEIDNLIFENCILEGMKKLKETLQVSLGDSIFTFSWRYDELAKNSPENFKSSLETYWKGFYS